MSPQNLSFDAIDHRGTGTHFLTLVTGAACTLGGVAVSFFADSAGWVGIPLAAVGIAAVLWAFRALPQTKYYPYFVLDESGIRYRDAPESKDIFLSWNRVQSARATDSWKDDLPGIEVNVISTAGHPDTRWLRMQFDHVDPAMRAIQAKLARNPSSNHALESGRAEERRSPQRER